MSNARNLSDLLGTGTTVATAKIADDAITAPKVADAVFNANKNLVINGEFRVSQRGDDINTITTDNGYTADRWGVRMYGGAGRFDYDQTTDTPTGEGFKNSAKYTVSTAASDVGTYGYGLEHRIEGHNIAHLMLGTSNAKEFTVSFWVKSSVAGTTAMNVRTTSADSSYTSEYTLAANTWKKIVKTVPANTLTLSNLNEGTGIGIMITPFAMAKQTAKATSTFDAWETGNYVFSTNQTNWMGTANNTMHITGVQVEIGNQATPFEYRSFATELQLCRRFYEQYSDASGRWVAAGGYKATNASEYTLLFNVQKRVSPTISFTGTGSDFLLKRFGTSNASGGTLSADNVGLDMVKIQSASNPSTHTTGQASLFGVYQTAKIIIDAEL